MRWTGASGVVGRCARAWRVTLVGAALIVPPIAGAGCGDDATSPVGGTGGAAGTASGVGTGGATGTGGQGGDGGSGGSDTVSVQILAFNDFHGNLEPPAGSSGRITLPDTTQVDAGGVAYFASRVAALRATNPNTVVVSAGDLIGASPLVSALFHDEPTIEAMNLLGLDINGVGNHEFDKGTAELLRMQHGGCSPVDGCADGTFFAGASFQFLAANVVVDTTTGRTLFPRYGVREFDGVKIAFIGMTLEGTPSIVTPIGVAGLSFMDEVDTVNAIVPELQAQGIEAIVVVLHEGGLPSGHFNECPGLSGPLVEIATNMDPAVDVIVSGHTHQAYNCILDDKVVTSAASFGRLVTDIDLEISRTTGEVTAKTANNVVVAREDADAGVDALVTRYRDLAAPLANVQIGTITATLDRAVPPMSSGLFALGAVIADAQLAATRDARIGGAEIAFMNPGGVRADLGYAASPAEPMDGVVTFGEAFTVQPFGNSLVVMTLTGAQIHTLLEQQFRVGAMGTPQSVILQVSDGFTYTYSQSAPVDSKVDITSIRINGAPLEPARTYRVAVNSFLASGGDGFTVLNEGTDRLGGALDLDALRDYFAANSPVSPPPLDRITIVP
ncbi:bifunctional metallophosphatase/5'-nucleotidase [Sorangium cellulosum]|uniref:Bifunctional metallophosphatase/5'-nucleotidase n=1 Tax=Sorangium cellulosum TaxID=56 RepID=A0A150QLV8_SORCE|nr:bifunctional metallophosphatase/5'-nucleotidase [Sorangium cellulosum]KYF68985.1 bifunctional metallophosphatase/5'-nucleotidase [Sorangium cellulosum]